LQKYPFTILSLYLKEFLKLWKRIYKIYHVEHFRLLWSGEWKQEIKIDLEHLHINTTMQDAREVH
jgi:hypothetical protein